MGHTLETNQSAPFTLAHPSPPPDTAPYTISSPQKQLSNELAQPTTFENKPIIKASDDRGGNGGEQVAVTVMNSNGYQSEAYHDETNAALE